jgi:ubiquinone biosynthesis monooxygenase Coq7
VLPSFLSSAASGLGGRVSQSLCPSSFRRPPTKQQLLAEILRVDHAGEYGAQRIYDGQLAVLGAGKKPSEGGTGVHAAAAAGPSGTNISDLIEEMRAQEIEHLRTLEDLLPQYRVRPTFLLPVWHVAGFGLGAASALLGPQAAMACTVAVEEVITDHYNAQLRTLNTAGFEGEREQALKKIIRKHRDDEEEHKHIGLQHDAEQAPLYKLMHATIQAGCHAAIWISKRV